MKKISINNYKKIDKLKCIENCNILSNPENIIKYFDILEKYDYKQKKHQILAENTTEKQYPEYYLIKGDNSPMKVFFIVSPEQPKISKKTATINKDGIKNFNVAIKGEIEKAFLYIDATVNYDRALTQNDDFYFIINGNGGHLTKDTAFATPFNDSSRFLYNMNAVSCKVSKETRNKDIKQICLSSLLQNDKILKIQGYINSDNPP